VATIAVVVGAAQCARAFGEIQRRGRYLAGTAAALSVAAVSGLSLCGRTEEELAVLAAAVVLVAITFWIWAVEQKDIRLNGFALSALAAGFAGVTLLAWGQGWSDWRETDASAILIAAVVPALTIVATGEFWATQVAALAVAVSILLAVTD